MLRSLLSGVTGLKSYQSYLDVTGNNIANVNTLGYKKSSATFEDLLYQTQFAGTRANETMGGINPKQVGLGTRIGAIDTIFSQGNIESTDVNSNMAIEGNGFFVVNYGGQTYYTRAGNFVQDGYGNLVQSGNGYELQGYMYQEDASATGGAKLSDTLTTVNIPMGHKLSAEATSVIAYRCNLDAGVESYLPMGIPDMTMQLSFLDSSTPPEAIDYQVQYESGEDAANFLTIHFENPDGTVSDITLEATGIDGDTGNPVLGLTSGATISLGGVDYPVTFDADTGELSVGEGGNEQVFSLYETMQFSSFSVEDSASGTTYDVLAEFDEEGAVLAFWVSDGTSLTRHTMDVSYAADGSFNDIDLADMDPALPGSLATNLAVNMDETGTSFTIQWLDPGLSVTSGVYEDVATISQNQDSIYSTEYSIYDSLGNEYTLELTFKKLGVNTWSWEASIDADIDIPIQGGSGVISFGSDGQIVDPGDLELEMDFSAAGAERETVTLDFLGETMGDGLGGVTQFGSAFTTKAFYQDGHSMGVLSDFQVQTDGTVVGIYDNDVTVPFYKIPLAMFNNPSGLEQAGDNVYTAGINSGNAQLVMPLEGGSGKILGQSLESSNVDIVDEFVNIIKGQRGYQANARMVTTSDEVLEETINLKR